MNSLDKLIEIAKNQTPINYLFMKEYLKEQEDYQARVFNTFQEHWLIINEEGITRETYDEETGEYEITDVLYDTYSFRFTPKGLVIYLIHTNTDTEKLEVIAQIEKEKKGPNEYQLRYEVFNKHNSKSLLKSFSDATDPYRIRRVLEPNKRKYSLVELVS